LSSLFFCLRPNSGSGLPKPYRAGRVDDVILDGGSEPQLMGCLIAILIMAGILTLPSIFGPLIFWSIAAILYYQSQSNKQQAQELSGQAKQLREQAQQHRELLKAVNPQAYQELVQREAEEAAKAEEERKAVSKRKLYAALGLGGVFLIFWIFGTLGRHSTSVGSSTPTATPEPTAVAAASMPSWATPTPEPSATENQTEVRRAIPVIASPTPTPYVEIPNPTDEQATAAFNDLQDQFHRPHAKSVTYHVATDSYGWIGPKTGKKMSMKRTEFIAELWVGYYNKINGIAASPTPVPSGKSEVAAGEKSIELFVNDPPSRWTAYYGPPKKEEGGGGTSNEWTISGRITLSVTFQDDKAKRLDVANVDGKPPLTRDEASKIMSSIGFKESWSRNANDETHWGDPTLGISASYDEEDGLTIWIENTVITYSDNSPEVVEQKARQLASLMHWSSDPDGKEAGVQDGMSYADLIDTLAQTKHLHGVGPKIEEAVIEYCPRFRGKPDSDERADYRLGFTIAVNGEAERKGLLKSDGSMYKPAR
jgi:hypothetical protein